MTTDDPMTPQALDIVREQEAKAMAEFNAGYEKAEREKAQPTVITAKQFVDERYDLKIAAGECVVQWENDDEPIRDVRKMAVTPTEYEIWFISDSWVAVLPERKLRVTWLPAASEPAAADAGAGDAVREYVISWRIYNGNECVAGGEAEYKGSTPENAKRRFMQDFNRQKAETKHTSFTISDPVLSAAEIKKQRQNELATLRTALAQATAEREAAEAKAAGLRAALEQVAAKSDPERPKRWENEQDTSFGVTLGWWQAGVIARKALEAAAIAEGAKHE